MHEICVLSPSSCKSITSEENNKITVGTFKRQALPLYIYMVPTSFVVTKTSI